MLELLPDDVLIIILRKLDLKSQANLCEVLESIRRIFMEYKIAKEYDISLSTSATVKTFQTQFFKIIATNLLKLNLSAVSDLCKTSLMPTITKLKHLKTLDVSYTKINLKDFIDIYKECPTINDLTIHIDLDPKYSAGVLSIFSECQKIFKNFECIHFLGSRNNLICNSVPFMLKLSNLKILQYTIQVNTILEDRMTFPIDELFEKELLSCEHFYVNNKAEISDHVFLYPTSFPFNVVEVESYEYLVIQCDLNYCYIYGSPVFNNFFKEKFEYKIANDFPVLGNSHIMLWMKNAHTFDEVFFKQLHKTIKQFLILYFPCDTSNSNFIPNYDRFCIIPREKENSNNHSSVEVSLERKRTVNENDVLDYDKVFQDKNEVELNLIFSQYYVLRTAITLNSECEYLKKLTYLNLMNKVKYSATFFDILFRSCIKLVTLNVRIANLNANDIVRAAPLSRTIKNLSFSAEMIDFKNVFTSLSQCSSLENVHIMHLSSATSSTLLDPTTMIQKCANLYCLHIYNGCELSRTKQAKQLEIIENIKTKFHKPYLNFKLLNILYFESIPYINVFNI